MFSNRATLKTELQHYTNVSSLGCSSGSQLLYISAFETHLLEPHDFDKMMQLRFFKVARY